MAPYDIGFRPEDLIPNIVFSPDGTTLSEEDEKKLGEAEQRMRGKKELLCRACGWNTYHELATNYLPRLRLFHVRQNAGLWYMGNDWLIWDRPGDQGVYSNEYMTYKFLREQGTKSIPLVDEMYQYGKEGDPFQFTVMSRVKGVTLESIWKKLTRKEKRGYAEQMTAALRELRQFTAPSPQRVDGSPLWDNIIGQCWPPKPCKTIPQTKEEWINALEDELRASIARQPTMTDQSTIFDKIKSNFPEHAPFVLTHADLNMGNIMVHDGKILAIIDWELAGYYPWWVERFTCYQRALSGNADELFELVWAELDPEHSDEDFGAKVDYAVAEAASLYSCAPIEHTHSHDMWVRPRWCECKPYGGAIIAKDWGAELKHEIVAERKDKLTWRERRPKKEIKQEETDTLDKQLEKVQL